MKGVLMHKNVLVPKEGWKRIGLTEEESNDVLGRVRWLNVVAMEQCLKDAELLKDLSPTNRIRVAIALFDKLGLHSFTALQEELASKIDSIRDAAGKGNQDSEQPGTES
jgi:hypothetical protein